MSRPALSRNHDNMDSMKRITVDLPDGLYKRLRLAAYTADTSVSEAVREHLSASLPPLPEEVQPK